MADFIRGDYDYIRISTTTVNARVVDKTKTSYEDIPSSVSDPASGEEYTVVSLEECFVDCESLTTAPTIPDSVTNMRYCFMGCTSLTSAPIIPNNVTNMNHCFESCTSLTTAPEIPNSVTDITYCFSNCTSLTTAPEIPNSVTNITYCFYGCESLTIAPEIPNSVTKMNGCFFGCESLTIAPEIPNSVTEITYCFSNCTSLTTAPEIPNNVTNMNGCFGYCTSLTTAPEIPNNVTKMDRCFKGCSSLTGNIYVNNNASNYAFIFDGTTGQTNDLYIIDNTQDKSVTTIWREIVAYTNKSKIHFEDDDHTPPQATLKLTRTDDSGKTSQTDTWVKIEIEYQIYTDYIPIGWTAPTFTSERFVRDSDVEFTPVGEGRERGPYNLEDREQHTITYTINDGYKTTTVTATLSRVMALLDFLGTGGQDGYIDIPGMGVAIGNIATRNGLDIQFPTIIGKGLLPPTKDNSDGTKSVDLDNYQLVVGKYNKLNNDAVFIIGNGSDDNNRSNLMEVGDIITFGSSDRTQSYMQLDYHSMKMIDREENPFFYVSDLRDKDDNNQATIVEEFKGDGYKTEFYINLLPSARISAIDTSDPTNTARIENQTYIFENPPLAEADVIITYKTMSELAKAYTFGLRSSNGNLGSMSIVEGADNTAEGTFSHAEGNYTTALGMCSHSEGYMTSALGHNSHAQNYYTRATKDNQTVIGKFNKDDTETIESKQKAFIIGNGKLGIPSNAFTVDWQGNVDIASGAKYKINGVALSASDVDAVPTSGGTITGDLTVEGVTYLGLDVDSSASKTTPATSGEDKDLFNAIRVLGWYDDVIV